MSSELGLKNDLASGMSENRNFQDPSLQTNSLPDSLRENSLPLENRELFFTHSDQLTQARKCADAPPERWFAALYQVFTDLTRLRGWTRTSILYLNPEEFPEGFLGSLCDSGPKPRKSHLERHIGASDSCCYYVRCCITGVPPTSRVSTVIPGDKMGGSGGDELGYAFEGEIVIPVPIHASLTLSNIDKALHICRCLRATGNSGFRPKSDAEFESQGPGDTSHRASIIFGFVDSDSTTAFYRIQEGISEPAALEDYTGNTANTPT